MFTPQLHKTLQVHHAEVGIGGALADQHLGPGINGLLHRSIVTRFDLMRYHTKAGQMFTTEFAAAVIAFIKEDYFVTALRCAISTPTMAAIPLA